jgi:hypothetical protein
MHILMVGSRYCSGLIRLARLLQPKIATAEVPADLGDEASSRGCDCSSDLNYLNRLQRIGFNALGCGPS